VLPRANVAQTVASRKTKPVDKGKGYSNLTCAGFPLHDDEVDGSNRMTGASGRKGSQWFCKSQDVLGTARHIL